MANKFTNSKSYFVSKWKYASILCLISVLTMLPVTIGLQAKTGASSRALDSEFTYLPSNTLSNPSDSIKSTPTPPHKITVYPWNNHLGRPAPIEWTNDQWNNLDCKEVPPRWQGKVRSIHTHDNCVVLYSRPNCKGSSKIVKQGSPSHNRLSDICFQRKPLSAKPCNQEEIIAPIKDHI